MDDLPYEVLCDAESRSEEWLIQRQKGIGASEMPKVLSVSKYGGPLAVWEAKRTPIDPGEPEPKTGPKARGKTLEPIIMQMAAEQMGVRVVEDQVLRRSVAHPWMLSTQDSWARESIYGDVLECKSVLFLDGLEGRASMEHSVQVHQQTEVLGGRTIAYVAVLALAEWRVAIYEVPIDREFIEGTMIPAGERFWQMVTDGVEPPLDASDESKAAWGRLHPQDSGQTVPLNPFHLHEVARWEAAKEQIKELEQRKKEAEAALKTAIGDATFGALPDGRRLSLKTTVRKPYQAKGSQFRQLRIGKGN